MVMMDPNDDVYRSAKLVKTGYDARTIGDGKRGEGEEYTASVE